MALEKPFRMGDSIANEILLSSAECSSEHAANGAALHIEAEIKLAFDHTTKSDDQASCTQEMKDLGLKRYCYILSCQSASRCCVVRSQIHMHA